MKPYFIIAIFILVASVLGALFFADRSMIVLFLFAELASLVSFYVFFSVIIPSLFPEYRNVDENFNCGADEIYLNSKEMYGPKTPFGGMKDK
ncbi:MAG TPA: hypothetical protein VMC84_02815 [Methanocella sp.]|uniref:hypothetical protein n=1 Tax=Methanocella sp. TaxID=2052833 RepID=UPI002BE2D7E3|nr:hypothetical protein [Methanocella sp.]HTY90085.1 hypothetical protein [Methanocella sp.]